MNDPAGRNESLPLRDGADNTAIKPGAAPFRTPPGALPLPLESIVALRHGGEPPVAGIALSPRIEPRLQNGKSDAAKQTLDRLETFAAQVHALAGTLPKEGVFSQISSQFLQIAEDVRRPVILAACGDFAQGSGTLLGALLGTAERGNPADKRGARAVLLQYGDGENLSAYGAHGAYRVGALAELKKMAQEDSGRYAALGRILAPLILELRRDPSRDRLLVFMPESNAPQDGAGESALSLLQRAEAVLWVTTAGSAATQTSSESSPGSRPPIELLLVNDLDCAGAENVTALVLRNLPEKAGDPSSGDRLAQLQAAVQRLRGSRSARIYRLQSAVSRSREKIEDLTRRLVLLAEAVDRGLEEARTRHSKQRGSKALNEEEMRRWEDRQSGSCAWLGLAEDRSPQEQDSISAPLRRELDGLRADFAALGRQKRSQEREQARNLEERRYLERRLQEVLEAKEQSESESVALQILNGLLGEDSESIERELSEAQALLEQCCAEEANLASAAGELAQRGDALEANARQLAAKIVQHLRVEGIESGYASGRRHAGLRKIRWQLQANATMVAAAASIANLCAALEEAVFDLSEEAGRAAEEPFEGCLKALRGCRHACDSLLHLRQAAGNARMLRIYRRILSIELQTMAEAVDDCSGVLHALDWALERVPRDELWRELCLFASHHPSPLAQFAEGLAGWLCEQDRQGAERAGRALRRLKANDETMAEVRAFVQHHGDEQSSEFLAALLTAAPRQMRAVLRSAPRASAPYRQALLMLGADLLTVFETGKSGGVN
jgi:hypothetical protein